MMRFGYLLIASSVLVLDQITKWIIVAQLSSDSIVPVIPGLFRLVRVENQGLAFGLLADSPSPLAFGFTILFSVMALGLLCFLLWKNQLSSRLAGAGLACILGGALGNLVDRVVRGSVVDFLDFYLGSYHWPAFNVADSAIVLGAGILLLELFGVRASSKLSWNRASRGNP